MCTAKIIGGWDAWRRSTDTTIFINYILATTVCVVLGESKFVYLTARDMYNVLQSQLFSRKDFFTCTRAGDISLFAGIIFCIDRDYKFFIPVENVYVWLETLSRKRCP